MTADSTSPETAVPLDLPEVPATAPVSNSITMYSTTWCGYCRRLKTQLESTGIAYNEINIEHDAQSAAFVESVNGGNQTVPTVLFPDGSTATNPSLAEVRERLGTASA